MRRPRREIALGLVLLASGVAGLTVALAVPSGSESAGEVVHRVVTEVGEVVTVTRNGVVQRVVRWRTSEGGTKTVTGRVRTQTMSDGTVSVYVSRNVSRVLTDTISAPARTVTVRETRTETHTNTRTETVVDVVTVTLPSDTVTVIETVTIPTEP
jgi:hypothetical protein